MLVNLAWLLVVLTLGLLSPGPDFLLIVKNSVGTPRSYALGTVAGIALGLAVQMVVISLGFVAAPPGVLRAVQFAGAAFLAYLGVRALGAAPGRGADATDGAPSLRARSGFLQGLLCNVTNPKAFLFFVSVFAQALRPDTPHLWRIVLPAAVVLHGALAWSLVVAALQSPPVARRLERAQRWLPRAFGAALIVLAGAVVAEAWRG